MLPTCSPMDCYTRTLCHWCWKTEAKLRKDATALMLEQRQERSRSVCTRVTSHNSWWWHHHKVWWELCNHTPMFTRKSNCKNSALSVTMTESPSACNDPLGLPFSWLSRSLFTVNKNPTRCNNMQIFIYCRVTLHVSGVTASIIRSTKNCNRSLRYRSYCKIQGLSRMN